MVRNRLGWDRETLGKYLGLSAREVYYIELGRVPSEEVVRVLKRFERLEPILTTLSTLLRELGLLGLQISTYLLRPLRRFWLRTKGEMVGDQLVLPCCQRIDYAYPLLVILPLIKIMLKTWIAMGLFTIFVSVLLLLT